MFCKASLLTFALALLAGASPITQHTGIHIPLSKRSSLTRPDGTFDLEAALKQKVKVQNKHRQNLVNLDRNIGLENWNEGAHIPDLASVPASIQARQSESLTDQQDNTEWTGTISIGTPPQKFIIDFDTGSSDLWVAAASCIACLSSHTYSASASSTSKEHSGTFEIEYGDGSEASGSIYTDTVSVAGVTVTDQYMAAVTKESGDLVGDVANGLLGMGFPAISSLNANPFFQTAVKEGAVPEGVFAFKLADHDSSLYIGGTDSSLYKGSIEYHDLSSSVGYWQIGGASAVVNGETVVSGFDTIIDSGTTLMYGPPSAVRKFYAGIEGSKVYDSSEGLWEYPCDSTPTVEFTWGGKKWSISPDDFNLGTASGSSCVGALGGQDLGLGSNVWLLGDTLLMNTYTAFSTDRNAVGFAALA